MGCQHRLFVLAVQQLHQFFVRFCLKRIFWIKLFSLKIVFFIYEYCLNAKVAVIGDVQTNKETLNHVEVIHHVWLSIRHNNLIARHKNN